VTRRKRPLQNPDWIGDGNPGLRSSHTLDEAGLAGIGDTHANASRRADRLGFDLVFEPELRRSAGDGGLGWLYRPRREG
jgi:hypothetical protein